ncbi:type VII secretion-associated serine protease mycosin [Streptomyces sp. NBC_01497]|uniref:type VII secretion-associated serine protease mycosin n=1 Tax=Streptomyces sp. NBC_01497 TaxID=2903885 RepID=UPI002E30C376|nr:type VII secretion-associated serine protease mycosin [Streptomyces sp. NBC_01497]
MGALLFGTAAAPVQAADTVRGEQWHLDAMEADQIWKITTGKGMTVAVIDSGVDKSLPDLQGQVLPGKDFSKQKGDEYNDVDGHGSGMADLIAGTGKRGPVQGSWGLAPGAKILPIRFPYSDERLAKDGEPYSTSMAKAIRYAADSSARVISISVADAYGDGADLDAAVRYALGKNKLIFAGVGNDGDKGNPVEYPAGTPGVVGVGGLDRKASRLALSETGPQVDISAPAQDIIKACPGGSELCGGSGTSDATALTSASAALLWSKHPDWTNNQVLRVLLNTASGPISGPRHNEQIGYGAVRPLVALKNPGDPGPADVYPLPDLAASEKKSASPSASAGAQPNSGSDSSKQSNAPSATAASDSGSGGSTGLWIGIGVAVVVVVAGATAFAVSRARRKTAAVAPPSYAYTTQPQPSYPPQNLGYPSQNPGYPLQQPPRHPGQYPLPPSGGQSGPPAGGA